MHVTGSLSKRNICCITIFPMIAICGEQGGMDGHLAVTQ
jgi:hypothetical protein